MDREVTFLTQLAERPEDRSLRLVFADWLQEQGDPRGEVIALCARGDLSLTEQRKVARLTTQLAARWLGPLARVADLHRTRFVDGFLTELVASVRPEVTWGSLVGDPRLATVTSFVVPPTQESSELRAFVCHPVLRRLRRLELGSTDWRALRFVDDAPCKPETVVVSSWGTFTRELAGLTEAPLFRGGRVLGLATTEFINGLVVNDVFDTLVAQSNQVAWFDAVVLSSRYGIFEGSAAWLLKADELSRAMPAVRTWGVEAGDVSFTRTFEAGRWGHLEVDLSLPDGLGERQLAPGQTKSTIEVRVATAASVLVLLGPARISSVEIKLAKGARLRPQERNTLLVAARRWGSLERFVVHGETVLP
ncbi:MAG: TIGR02996 domain-containing protein [Myxococcota bacterium]